MEKTEKKKAEPRVFLFFSSAEIADLLAFSLQNRFQCEVGSFTQATAAVSTLKAEKFTLAVLDSSLSEGMLILEQVRAAQIPFVLYHPDGTSPEIRGPKVKANREKELLPAVEGALRKAEVAERPDGGANGVPFAKVSLPLLVRASPLPADLFIRLSDLKFVKLFHKATEFEQADKQKYYDKKKLSYLYVRRDALPLVAEAIAQALERLLQMKRPPRETVVQVTVDTVETVHELARQVGFTPEVQKMVKANMDLVVKEMQAVPSLAAIFANFERNKDRYIAAHSQMLAEISCAVAIAMEWGSDMSLKKISMAALLHDMCMTDHRLCAVKDIKELDARKGEFTLELQEEYKSHPKRAALLIQGMKEVPADVDKIVYQHHEQPKGGGFPEALGHTHIHPLAATLMISHDLVDWIIDHPGKVDLEAFLAEYREKYQAGSFKKILKALETLQF